MRTPDKVHSNNRLGGSDQMPPSPPWSPGSSYWCFWNNEFVHPIMPYPTEQLLGKTSLDYSLVIADVNLEQGSQLSPDDEELLRLAHDYPYSDFDDLVQEPQ